MNDSCPEDLNEYARRLLRARGLAFRERAPRNGLIADFVVDASERSGQSLELILLTRLWTVDEWPWVESYARREGDYFSGQQRGALVVRFLVPSGGVPSLPLLTLDGLEALLADLQPAKTMRSGSATEHRPIAFCAMPFREDFLDVFLLAIAPAAHEAGVDIDRVDQAHSLRRITTRIWDSISAAQVVIADISGHNPNVMYEVGLAHGLGCGTFILRDATTETPFDVRDQTVLVYERTRLHLLREELPGRLREALKRR